MMTATRVHQIHYIDDSDDEAFLSGLLLESQNVQVELVHHTQYKSLCSVATARKDMQPLLILADLNMPAMKGDKVIRKFLETHGRENIVIGICSGSEDPADKQSAKEAGADFFVNKPLDIKSLAEICSICSELNLEERDDGGIEISWKA